MKKKWMVLIVLLSLVVVAAACIGGGSSNGGNESGGDSNATTDTGAGAADDATTTTADEDDGSAKQLTVWHIETGEQKDMLEEAVARFAEEHNVEVEMVQQENDPYKTNLVVAMGANNPPDIFHSWGGGWLKQFADAGQVVDITNEIDADHYMPAGLSTTTFDGKVYGVPLTLSLVPIYYNTEIFDQYGLTPPETYSELLEVIDTLNENDIIPFALANQPKWPGAFYLMYFADRLAGADLFNEAFGREGRGFDDPEYVRAGELIQELVGRNAFPEGFNGLNYDTGQSRSLMYSDRAAMIMQTTGFIGDMRSEAPDFEEKMDIFPFPTLEEGEGDPSNIVGGVSPVFSVASATEHPDLAIELIKYLTSLEIAQQYVDITGKVSAVQGVVTDDPFGQRLAEFLENANNMQTFYDQTLPPELGELHKDTTQALFGFDMTPLEAAQLMEEKAVELLDE